ncbi:Lysylphosphatidylglycerol synthase TM region [Candidatus Tiddalikarchaeum anstoanum]|nr:Lysylphosphatidylglycerol synthase TM region [Candidatus Tiddalikarchaeum anstoanum]
MNIKKLLLIFLSIIFFIYLFSKYDIKAVLNALLSISPFYIIIFIVGSIFSQLIKSIQWIILVKIFTEYSLKDAFFALIIGTFSGRITPGQVGDFSRGFILSKATGISKSKALSTVFMDKIISYFSIFIICFFSVFLNAFEVNNLLYLIAGFAFFFACIVAFFLYIKYNKFFIRIIPNKFRKRVSEISEKVNDAFKTLMSNKKALFKSLLVSIIYWLFTYFITFVFLLGFKVYVPFYFVTLVFPLITIISMLPISFSGFGLREVSLVYFFGLLNIPAEGVISFSLSSSILFILSLFILNVLIANSKSLKIYQDKK